MAYPYVQAYHDLGPARGPRLGFLVHMAEGGGTVGYLSRPNANGVSVHYVIENTGRIVQMLRLDHMHTSIRTAAIRMTDDEDGFYGRTAAKAVLGAWADTFATLGPNHATIAVEVEGFASAGPNAAQTGSLKTLVADIRGRYPGIGLLGHRDFASYKACPGKLIAWDILGGHGGNSDMPQAPITDPTPRMVTVTAPHWYDLDNRTALPGDHDPLTTPRFSPYGVGSRRAIIVTPGGGTARVVLVTPATVASYPAPGPVDCTAAITAELDRAAVRASQAVKARP